MKPLVALALLGSFPSLLLASEVFVSPSGNDQASGAGDAPFATLERARDAVRELRKAGRPEAATIWLADGVYRLEKTLECGAEDVNVTFRAQNPGKAILDAAKQIAPGQWQPSKDERLPAEARGKALELNLATAGVALKKQPDRFNDLGGFPQLFFGDRWQALSRWPNERKARMQKVLDRGDDPGAPGKRPGTFAFAEERPLRWKAAADAGGLWLAGFWRVAWDWQAVRVAALDPEKRTILLAAPVPGGIGSKYAGPEGAGTEPWIAINLVEEIDQPGEWAIDARKGALFFWPPGDLQKSSAALAYADAPAVRMLKASQIALHGLVLTGALGNGVEIQEGSDCLVSGCELRCIGKNGVVVKGGLRHRVESSDFHELGSGGILLGGGDRATLTPAGHSADNNHIYRYALGKKIWSPGVGVGANDAGYACGCSVTHNLIHDSPHAAILYGGNDHRIEYNEIHDFLVESDDLGGLYTNNGWLSYGNVLRHNFIHHTAHALGIYLDDGDSGDLVEGNLAYKMGAGVGIGGGHDNIIQGNLSIDCPVGVRLDARGVSRKYDKDPNFLRDLDKLKPALPPWSERYPTLATAVGSQAALPIGCVVENNVSAGGGEGVKLHGKPEHFKPVLVQGNYAGLLEDLGLAQQGETLDFRIPSSAPIFTKAPGFAAIPVEKIGLYLNGQRKTLPSHPSGHTRSEWHSGKE